MTNTELLECKIEELENNGYVIVSLVLNNGTEKDITSCLEEDENKATAVNVVTVEEYENNGYKIDGLLTTTVKF